MKKIIFGLLLFLFAIVLSYGQKDTLYYKEQVITNLLDVKTLHAISPNQHPKTVKIKKFKTGYNGQISNLDSFIKSDFRNDNSNDYYSWSKNNGSNSYQNDYEGPQKTCNDEDKCKK